MAAIISYGTGYTAIGAAAGTVTIAMPPVYSAGDFLLMAVTAGGTSDTVTVTGTAPSGWTALSGPGTAPSVFYRTATGTEPASYTVTLSASATASGFTAAYPAATIAASSFKASGVSITSYSPAFPSGVTSGQTVLLVEASVSSGTNVGWGGSNFDLPAGWATQVPVFGQSMPSNTPGVMPCAIGLAGVTGSASAPVLKSPLLCQVFAAYVVLNVTGPAPAAPYTVTATASGTTAAIGLALTVKALTGAASLADTYAYGAYAYPYAGGTSQAPSASLTPFASGSYVYGAVTENIGVTAGTAYTAASGTTFSQNIQDAVNACAYGTFRGTSATTAGTPVTLGGSAPVNAYFVAAAAEILAAGTLAETATATASAVVPGDFATTSLALPAYFASPPASGTLLVAMVSANSSWGNGGAVFTITDSLGLAWVSLAESAYPGYAGVWAASVAPLTAAAALAVAPSGTASRVRGHARTAALAAAPSRLASASGGGGGGVRTASLAVTPARAASRAHGSKRTASLAVIPSRAAAGTRSGNSHTATAALAVTPARLATAARAGLVQSVSGSTTGTSLTLTFPAAVTPGNAVIACIAGHYDGTVTSLALGTSGGAFTHLGGAGGTGGNNADIYMLPAAAQSSATLTVTASSAGIIAFAYELTGAVVYFDVIKGGTGTGTSWSSGSSAETIPWPHVIIGIGAVTANSGTVTGPSGWVNRAVTNVAGAGPHAIGAVSGYLQEPSAVSCTYSGTAASSSAWGAAVAAFLVVPRGGNAWGGYEFNEHSAAGYTGVTATFTIPSSLPSSAAGECSVWVGIGNVYQVGIFMSPSSAGAGNVATSPWSWWFGGGGGAGELWDQAAYPTGAGNSLTLSLTVDGSYWRATIANSTLGWSYTEVRSVLGLNVSTWNYNGTTGVPTSWGWIYPVPFAVVVIEQEATDLPQYGTIAFTGITTTPAISQSPDPQFTAFSATGGISQYPGPFNVAAGSYSMTWNQLT